MLVIGKWTVKVLPRMGQEITDKDCDKVLESLEWIESELSTFVESKLPAKLLGKVSVEVSDD